MAKQLGINYKLNVICEIWNYINFYKMMSNVKSFGVGIVNLESVIKDQNSAIVWTKIFVLH